MVLALLHPWLALVDFSRSKWPATEALLTHAGHLHVLLPSLSLVYLVWDLQASPQEEANVVWPEGGVGRRWEDGCGLPASSTLGCSQGA